jgi:hypothetical protein
MSTSTSVVFSPQSLAATGGASSDLSLILDVVAKELACKNTTFYQLSCTNSMFPSGSGQHSSLLTKVLNDKATPLHHTYYVQQQIRLDYIVLPNLSKKHQRTVHSTRLHMMSHSTTVLSDYTPQLQRNINK